MYATEVQSPCSSRSAWARHYDASEQLRRPRVSQIIKGYPGMSLKMLAKLEVALGFRLDAGFSYPGESASCVSTIEIPRLKNNVNLRDETTCKTCGSLDLSICKGGLKAA